MWRSRNSRGGKTVVCIACGTSLPRAEAREYDKEGDRWDRQNKAFEHLCKACHRGICHQPRGQLESLLLDAESGDVSRGEFLARYLDAIEEREAGRGGRSD